MIGEPSMRCRDSRGRGLCGSGDEHICGRSLSAIKVSLGALYSEDVATMFARLADAKRSDAALLYTRRDHDVITDYIISGNTRTFYL